MKDPAANEINTALFVGSVRGVKETAIDELTEMRMRRKLQTQRAEREAA